LPESKWSPIWTPGPTMSPSSGSAPIVTPDFAQLLFCLEKPDIPDKCFISD